MAHDSGLWWSIEVLNGPFSADRWRDSHGRALFEAAVTHGALDWSWVPTTWGLVLEIEFPDAETWSVFRRLPGVQAALDAVPDPIHGLFVFPGRGGSEGALEPRRPHPYQGAGGAALPMMQDQVLAILAEEMRIEVPAPPLVPHMDRAA
jgi:hypothetical protein